ncbi:hypothetical protein [Streptomyces sp. NPDC093261]|uniref:hypothetical protein n=1 Tax=Streptomyces sp. NPDC093261 TaxID=3366037 RepID=UPI003807A152
MSWRAEWFAAVEDGPGWVVGRAPQGWAFSHSLRLAGSYRHAVLVDITVAGGVLSSTAGHRFFVKHRGWTLVSVLRVGDSLRTPDGTFRTVTAVKDGLV